MKKKYLLLIPFVLIVVWSIFLSVFFKFMLLPEKGISITTRIGEGGTGHAHIFGYDVYVSKSETYWVKSGTETCLETTGDGWVEVRRDEYDCPIYEKETCVSGKCGCTDPDTEEYSDFTPGACGSKWWCKQPCCSRCTTETYGGFDLTWTAYACRGCGMKFKVNKNGITIYESERWLTVDSFENVELKVTRGSTGYNGARCDCLYVAANIVYIIPEGSFDLNITDIEDSYNRGEIAQIKVKAKSYFGYDAKLLAHLDICIPTLIGDKCDRLSQEVDLHSGEEELILFEIPTTQITDQMRIKSSAIIQAKPSIDDDWIEVGSIIGDEKIVEIRPLMELGPNQLLAVETFGAGQTISKYSTRYPVVVFSPLNPVIITDTRCLIEEVTEISKACITTSTEIYRQLDAGETIQIPSDETWTLFYIIENNYQLPTVCDGPVDVETGDCAVALGIVMVCSQGQFDPELGLCVVQGTLQTVCPDYARYDTALAMCVWNPPEQADCSYCADLGCIYNVDSKKCEFEPEIEIDCPEGSIWSEYLGKCMYRPEAVCPEDSVWNPALDKCEYFPLEEWICELGFTYNSYTGKCEYEPPNDVICPGDYWYDGVRDACVIEPDTQIICPEGHTYVEVTGLCTIEPETGIECPEGYTYNMYTEKCEIRPEDVIICPGGYEFENGKCTRYPDKMINCPQGYAFDLIEDKCLRYPVTEIVCLGGSVYEDGKCVYRPEETIKCPQGSEYDSDSGKCIREPIEELVCPDKYEYNLVTDKCEYLPPGDIICTGGYDYNEETKLCEYRPNEEILCGTGGTYVEEKGYCIREVPTETVCERGILNEDKTACYYTPPSYANCPVGIFDKERNACVFTPNLDYLCIVGELSVDKQSCIIHPTEKVVCRAGFVYDEKSDICVRRPGEEEGVDWIGILIQWWWVIVVIFVVIILLITFISRKK